MTQADDLFLVKSREYPQEIEVSRDRLSRIFSLVERGELLGTLEVYRDKELVGLLRHAPDGLWQIGWHTTELANHP